MKCLEDVHGKLSLNWYFIYIFIKDTLIESGFNKRISNKRISRKIVCLGQKYWIYPYKLGT